MARGIPGSGIPRRGKHHMERLSVGFDPDTFAQMRAIAERNKTSLAETVRQLVEDGLYTAENG